MIQGRRHVSSASTSTPQRCNTTGLAPNFTYMLDGQATHIAHVITEVKAREAKSVEPTREAEAEWVKRVTGPTFITEYQNTCTPGYYNGEGKNEGQGFLEAQGRSPRHS